MPGWVGMIWDTDTTFEEQEFDQKELLYQDK